MPWCFSLLCPVQEPSSFAPHWVLSISRVSQFLDADKDFPVTQDSHQLRWWREKKRKKKSFKWFKAHFHWTLCYIFSLLPKRGKLEWVHFPPPCLLQHLVVSCWKLEMSWRKRNAKVATRCLCPRHIFGIWVTLFCLVHICDNFYLYPGLFPVHTHQHGRISYLSVSAAAWKHTYTQARSSFFSAGTDGVKV